ncbi:hypothetical protein [Rhodococcus opacus]|uniref:hypothetical protein n=1 Tax=Rhodococcus opacus TaxID=37919 RepID=UPI00211E3C5C|nr:hypothetical protein [Rhodococcus opacus]
MLGEDASRPGDERHRHDGDHDDRVVETESVLVLRQLREDGREEKTLQAECARCGDLCRAVVRGRICPW